MRLIRGKVIRGEGWGGKLGYPTANLTKDYYKKHPVAFGVYAALIKVGNRRHKGLVIVGAPSLFRKNDFKLEAYLLDFKGNLFGKKLEAELVKKIRPVKKFYNTGMLLRQVRKDVQAAKKILNEN